MTFADWIRSRAEDLERTDLPTATKAGLQELWQGALRRTAGRFVTGESVWSRADEWDILCILDGCRVDLMREVCDAGGYDWLPDSGSVESMASVGTTSPEWINETFGPPHREYAQETAYVTANGFVSQTEYHDESWSYLPMDDSDFGFLHEAWETLPSADVDGVSSTDPADLTEYGLRAWNARDRLGVDRLIIHYMQPHAPFRQRPEWNEGATNAWELHRDGLVASEDLWSAYRDNLEWVLDSVARIQASVDADLCLSADHGNGMGEWGIWAHPPQTVSPKVRRVPWVRVDTTGAGDDLPDRDLLPENAAETDVRETLENLGYL